MSGRAPATAFYCVADSRYFPGAVAMVNSLRLHGHGEPIHLLDLGLSAEQRELLAPQVSFAESEPGAPPWLAKTVAPLRNPAETMVLIDADMVVTRPLDELVERARVDGVVAFENDSDRFCPEWAELLGLTGLTRRRYVSSGFVALGGERGLEVLRALDALQHRVELERGFYGANEPGYAFLYPEQDVLNAILAAEPADRAPVAMPHRLAPVPPFDGLRLSSARAGRCEYEDGSQPFLLHHYLRKPWLEPMYHGVYSRLLVRLTLGDDVAIRLPPRALPFRMRPGPLPWLERRRVDAIDLARWRLRR